MEQGDEKAAQKAAQPGPFIFASCHEDVAGYLQPEYICVCAVGEAPTAFRNPQEGASPQLQAGLRGNIVPKPTRTGHHQLVGHWRGHSRALNPFMIIYKACKEPGILRLVFEGGGRVEWLRRNDDPHPDDQGGDWFSGLCAPEKSELRVRALDVSTLVLQRRKAPHLPWLKEMHASRRHLPQPVQVLMLAREPENVVRSNVVQDYKDCDAETMSSHGWYLPPELSRDMRYTGLERSGEPQKLTSADFRYDSRMEAVDDCQSYLATYVGEPDGSLGTKLQNVSRLLDCPFDGLCVHALPNLPDPGDFAIGVVTGPSGSGKSTLTRNLFGPGPTVSWMKGTPVLAQFASLASAREFCGAAALDLNVAMRPFQALSGGEQSRADLARCLERAVVAAGAKGAGSVAPRPALVLEEFTSLVDRPTARRMARGVQRVTRRRGLRRVVVVSCHDDFVGKGLLEPDWLFECHNRRLLRFTVGESPGASASAMAKERLRAAEVAKREVEAELALLHEQLAARSAAPCFSADFKAEVRALGAALVALGDRELRRRQDALAGIRSEAEKAAERALLEQKRQEAAEAEEELSAAKSAGATCAGIRKDESLDAWAWRVLAPPVLELEVRRALPREWVHFREHHYKDHGLHTCSVAFVGLLDGRAACFLAIINEGCNFVQKNASRDCGTAAEWADSGYPTPWLKGEVRRLYREHRTVVLPDFQGMGLAPLLCDAVGTLVLAGGHDFTSQTVHPFYGSYRDRSPFWRPLPSNRKERSCVNGNVKYSHFFVGATRPDGEEDPALAEELRRRVLERH